MLNQVAIEPTIGCAYGAGDEVKANANLMAAAPELLAACQAMMRYQALIENDATSGLLEAYADAFEGAQAAVAKATGAKS